MANKQKNQDRNRQSFPSGPTPQELVQSQTKVQKETPVETNATVSRVQETAMESEQSSGYFPQPIKAAVLSVYSDQDVELVKEKADLQKFFDQRVYDYADLLSGHKLDENHSYYERAALRQNQSGVYPVVSYKENAGRAQQTLLTRWMAEKWKVTILFYEPNVNNDTACYAWLFEDVIPTNSGYQDNTALQRMNPHCFIMKLHYKTSVALHLAIKCANQYLASKKEQRNREDVSS